MHPETRRYNEAQAPGDRAICERLAEQIDHHLPEAENKIWHAHPVWFLDGNPVVGYSKLKSCVRLLFWSGQSFEEEELQGEGSFKAAEVRFTAADQVDPGKLQRWLAKSRDIQWDYKNLARHKGRLQRLKQRHGILEAVVELGVTDWEPLGDLAARSGSRRAGGDHPFAQLQGIRSRHAAPPSRNCNSPHPPDPPGADSCSPYTADCWPPSTDHREQERAEVLR
jgi:uncharacterized protein YdhG (YjbR/CyaY superfamily)